jgi:hypothetical protein
MDENNQIPNTSPLPPQEDNVIIEQPQQRMDFFVALKELYLGKRITKLEWGTTEIYGLLTDDAVKLYWKGELKDWIITYGDMSGQDWVILPEVN